MATGATIAKNTALLTLANLAMRLVAMGFQVYLTGQVGAAGMGLLQLILTVNGFAITLGTAGVRVGAMYLSAEEYGLGRPGGIRSAMVWCLGLGAAVSTVVGVALAGGADLLAMEFIKDLRAAPSLRLLGLSLPLTCLSGVLSGYFTACGKIKRLVAVEIGDRILTVGLTVWLLNRGLAGDLSHACTSIVAGGALASVGSVAVLLFLLWLDLRKAPKASSYSMGKRLIRLCVPLALNDYLRSGLNTLEQFLIPHGLSRSSGSRTQALADYGTIHAMVFPVLMFPTTVLFAVSDLLVPELAMCRAQKNQTRIRHMTQRCLDLGFLFSFLITGLFLVLAKPLGYALYREPAAGRYLLVFTPMIPMLYLDCLVDGMHKGLGQQVYCVRINTLTSFLDVVLLFLLLPKFGIAGYYVSFLITHGINFWLSLGKLLSLTEARLSAARLLTMGLCIGVVTLFVRRFVPVSPHWSDLLTAGGIYLLLAGLLLSLAARHHILCPKPSKTAKCSSIKDK